MVLLALVLSIAALTPQEIAEISREQDKAVAEISARYGNRKLNELTADERRQHAIDLTEAQRKVLEKHQVEPREWALSHLRQGREEREAIKKAGQALEEKEKAEAQKGQKVVAEDRPVSVQRGFSDANPVVLEEGEGTAVVVEKGLPAEAKEDQELAAEHDRLEGVGGEARGPVKPTRGRGRK